MFSLGLTKQFSNQIQVIMKRISKDKSNKNVTSTKRITRSTKVLNENEPQTSTHIRPVLSQFINDKTNKSIKKSDKQKRSHLKVELDQPTGPIENKIKNELVDVKTEPDLIQSELKVDVKTEPDLHRNTQLVPKNNLATTTKTRLKEELVKDEFDEKKKLKLEPENWEIVMRNLREMRKDHDAPVDNMGCDKCMDENAPAQVMRYQTLLSLMLSSQTKDQVTHAAMEKLKAHGCTVSMILETSDDKLGELIYPVSFWKTKVKHIKATTEILKTQYNDDIPNNILDLCKLPGVGPKMAHLCMKSAWNIVSGIGVDVHVHRITNRLGWVRNTKTPENTRKELEEWLPQELWSEVNHLLVGFGQQICQSLRPKCATCLNYDLCPYGQAYLGKNLTSKITIKKK